MLIPKSLLSQWPAERDNQCQHLRMLCVCGKKFSPDEFVCASCGKRRLRCKAIAIDGTDACRQHTKGRPLSIYNVLAGKVGDNTLEELVANADSNDVLGEFVLAKVALARAAESLRDGESVDATALLTSIQSFFKIATDYKKFTTGETLNINMNENVVLAVRKKFRTFIQGLKEALEEFVPDEETRNKILAMMQMKARTLGNSNFASPTSKSKG